MKINLTLFISPSCPTCSKVKRDLMSLFRDKKYVTLKIKDISNIVKPKIIIVPALFVNEELYSYGEFNEEKLRNYITSKINLRI